MLKICLLINYNIASDIFEYIIFVCQNISSFSASLLVGACVDGGNWGGAVIPLLGVACAGLVFAILGAVFSLRKERQTQTVS